MHANFAACLAFTLRFEGGRSDDPQDPGGRTREGVTQRTFAAWLAAQHRADRDVFSLTVPERDAIYRTAFWAPVGGDGLGDGVDLAVFDFAVNSGPKRALASLAARRTGDGTATVKALCAARLSFLGGLRGFARFGRGWTARVAACEALGVKMAEHARIGLAPTAPPARHTAGRLLAESRTAAALSRKQAGAATVVATGGALTHPITTGAFALPWPVALLLGALGVVAVALIAWRAWQAAVRARAYAALAATA